MTITGIDSPDHSAVGSFICPQREHPMKPSTKDQMEGKFHDAKGSAKEKAGQAVNNPDLAARGRDEKIAGKVQNKAGQIEKVFNK